MTDKELLVLILEEAQAEMESHLECPDDQYRLGVKNAYAEMALIIQAHLDSPTETTVADYKTTTVIHTGAMN